MSTTLKSQSLTVFQIDSIANSIDSLKADQVRSYVACGGYRKKHHTKYIGSFSGQVIERKDSTELLKVDLTQVIKSVNRYIFYFSGHSLIKIVVIGNSSNQTTTTMKSEFYFQNEKIISKIGDDSDAINIKWLVDKSRYYLKVLPDNKKIKVVELKINDRLD